MPELKRKYTTKSGEVKVYTYNKTVDTPAKIKRDHLIRFIQIHQDELNEISKKKDKIQYIQDNIDDTYSYSDSMIYRHISKSSSQESLDSQE